MLKSLFKNSLQTRIVISFFLLSLVASMISLSVYQWLMFSNTQNKIVNYIASETHHTSAHILTYIEGIEARLVDFSSDGQIISCLAENKDPNKTCDIEELTIHLKEDKLPIIPGMIEVHTFDTNVSLIATSKEDYEGTLPDEELEYIKDLIKNNKKLDLVYMEHDKSSIMLTFNNVKSGDEEVGYVVGIIKTDELFEILTNRATLGSTGEIILVNKDLFMISPSRFSENAQFKQKIETNRAQKCIADKKRFNIKESDELFFNKSITKDLDYRGEKIWGLHDYFEEQEWCLLTKIDEDEALKSFKIFSITISAITGIINSAYLILAFILGISLVSPLIKITKSMLTASKGDLNKQIVVDSSDEIGMVSKSFNQLIKSRLKVEEELSSLFENAAIGLAKVSPDGKFNDVNEKFCQIVGYSKVELIKKTFQDITHPDDITQDENYVKQMLSQKISNYSMRKRYIRKDKSIIWVNLTVGSILNDKKEISHFISAVEDISKLVNEEKQVNNLNETLKIINKILRHDILNDLTVVDGTINNYLEYKKPKNVNELLSVISESVRRDKKLIEQMRDLEKAVSSGNPLQEISLSESISRAKQNFEKLVIESTGDSIVMADEALTSIFTNLFRNARDHGLASEIKISVKVKKHLTEIAVADNGKGIPDDTKSKLFKEGAKFGETGNTGLGLYIISKTISRYGGSITVKDNKPKGTIFTIIIPSVD